MSEYEDIVEELLDWADIIDKSQGRASVIMLSGEVYRAAAEEILKLREASADLINMIRRSENDFIDDNEWDQTINNLQQLISKENNADDQNAKTSD